MGNGTERGGEAGIRGKRCLDVGDMPVYAAFFELAVDLEKATRGKGKPGTGVREETAAYLADLPSTMDHQPSTISHRV